MKRHTYFCTTCGSDDVWLEAKVIWDEGAQKFTYVQQLAHHTAWCHDCQGEVELKSGDPGELTYA